MYLKAGIFYLAEDQYDDTNIWINYFFTISESLVHFISYNIDDHDLEITRIDMDDFIEDYYNIYDFDVTELDKDDQENIIKGLFK